MLEGKTYCPVLHTRVAEMKALQMLSPTTKDLIFPLIVARPWPNARKLENTWKKIEDCLGNRRFGLYLDPFKRGSVKADAGREFDALFDSRRGFEKYYGVVNELAFAIPVLQYEHGTVPELARQCEAAESIGRGAILRLHMGHVTNPIADLTEVHRHLDDVVVWVDLGWGSDLLHRELWASRILEQIGRDNPDSEVVVSGSSFPASFDRTDRDVARALEREVHDNLVRRHNAVRVTYGDWGSTRAPQDPTPMRIVKRIDLPNSREWIYFKDDGAETYQDIAERVLADPAWPKGLGVWGTYVIESTAEDIPGSIRGQAAAAAARVNIHLHQQAHFGNPAGEASGDEPFTDEF